MMCTHAYGHQMVLIISMYFDYGVSEAKCRKIHILDFFQIKRANARSPWKFIKTCHFLSYTKEPLEKRVAEKYES